MGEYLGVRYGQRFRELRIARKLTQVQVQGKLKLKGQGSVSLIESSPRDPTLDTVLKHARVLECAPSELLKNVETVYDHIRTGKFDSGSQAMRPKKVGEVSVPTRRRRHAS